MSLDTSDTIYERIGGEKTIDSIIELFYPRITADPVLSSYFTHANVGKIMSMQKHFFTAATGGPLTYGGRPLGEVHHKLGISRYEFDLYVRHLTETLMEIGLSEEDCKQVVASINIYAPDITTDMDAF
ncbi:MAG: group 1 truncated hemoglobin [Verrucomicrobiales bacterium]|nr:group 1 truncated hemoglobin [Verrucomicrobiales bacterium]